MRYVDMKKFLTAILSCLTLCVGLVAFSGCNGQNEITNISVETLPTTTIYTVGDSIDLSGGVLKVEYKDGKSEEYPLSVATPSVYTFNTAGSPVIVTLTYKGKDTTIGVTVNKRELEIDRTQVTIPDAVYTGEALPVDITKVVALPNEVSASVEYKVRNADDATYTNTAPIDAGEYAVRVSIDGNDVYGDWTAARGNALVLDYTINKASLQSLAKQANGSAYLDYDMSSLGTITYGTVVDFARLWSLINGSSITQGLAPLDADIRAKLNYEYRVKGENSWLPMTRGENESVTVNLNAGEYEMRVSLLGDSNILDFSKEFALNISPRALVQGVDYTLQLGNLDEFIDLSTDTSNVTTVTYNGSAYVLVLKPSEALTGQIQFADSVNYNKVNDSAYFSQAPMNAGEYVATYAIDGGVNYTRVNGVTIRFNISKVAIETPELAPQQSAHTGEAIPYTFDDRELGSDINYVIEYALDNGGELSFLQTAPSAAGTYVVRITFNRSTQDLTNYDMQKVVETTLTITE